MRPPNPLRLRAWQERALQEWKDADFRGIVSVVTGGGKTVFALAAIAEAKPEATLVVVPSAALLDQWWELAASYFGLNLDDITVITGRKAMKVGTINIAVLNTAARLAADGRAKECMLVVDECHRAAAPTFKSVLDIRTTHTLGLSATPRRPYDDGLDDILVPRLGSVVFEYSYSDALADGVIVPFTLHNVVFELEADRQEQYDKLTRAIGRAVDQYGVDAKESVALMLRRARVLNLSLNRVRLALHLIARHRGRRILVFHEDIEACDLIHEALDENGVKSGVYHSKMPVRKRAEALRQFRDGTTEVLVTCKALDEGFDVPEAEIGIIAASTATRRQRIQRLGRVLRPASDKDKALVYSLVATDPEVARLRSEENELRDVAEVVWSRA